MGWRYYVKTAAAANGDWIDSSAQLSDVELTYELNSPFSGKALIPYGQYGPDSASLLSYWKRYGAAMYAEEDGEINWGGLCVAANPSESGLALEFIGSMGWLTGVIWNNNWTSWEINAKTVVDMLVTYSQGFGAVGAVWPITTSGSLSGVVGDTQPPAFPVQPPRLPGQKKSEYEDSVEYMTWQVLVSFWNALYGARETYKIQYWNSTYVGAEIESIIAAVAANYRESYSWLDVDARTVTNNIELGDSIVNIRSDIRFEDGVNLAQKIDTKDNTRRYFQQAITLGAGEGVDTRIAAYNIVDTDHYYQGYWGSYREVYDTASLTVIANSLVTIGSNPSPVIDNIVVWDIASPGLPKVSSLRVGDVVQVLSTKTIPNIDQWCRITKIVKNPEKAGIAQLSFQIIDIGG